jgi:di/tricarboxylate transporter
MGLMTPQIVILAVTTLLAFVLMMLVNLSPDLVALLVMIALGLTGILTPAESFAGFSSQAVITLLGAFIMTRALTVTGATQKMGKILTQAGAGRKDVLPPLVMAVSAGLSLFTNKVVAASILLPVATHAAQRRSIPLYKIMMPLAFATSLGGMATLLNTGNLVVSETLNAQGYAGYGLLEFLPVGLPVAIIGIGCIWLLLQRFTPQAGLNEHPTAHSRSEKLINAYQLGERVNFVHIPISSNLVGLTLAQSQIGEKYLLTVLSIQRKNQILLAPARSELLAGGDRLMVVGREEQVQKLTDTGVEIESFPTQLDDLLSGGNGFFEVVPSIRSEALGQTLKQIHFRERYGATVVAVWNGGRSVRTNQGSIPLPPGCALLAYGPYHAVRKLQNDPDFTVTQAPFDPETPTRPGRAPLAITIILAALVFSALQVMPVAQAMLAGGLLMALTGCIKMQEAYQSVDWRTIFLIAGMSSISLAMTKTGAAALISQFMIGGLAPYGPLALAAALLLATMLFTQVVSGQVAAFFLAPIAISAAQALQVDPRAMAMYVAFGASLTFLTPAAHSANLLVMGTGGYLPRDYLRLGLPLTVVLFGCILSVVPVFFPF